VTDERAVGEASLLGSGSAAFRGRPGRPEGVRWVGAAVPEECPVELGELRSVDRQAAGPEHLAVGAEPEPVGGRLLALIPESGGQILARDPQRSAVRLPAPHEQVHMRVVGVVVVDGDPFEGRTEVALTPSA
jgi:hypothetical protein